MFYVIKKGSKFFGGLKQGGLHSAPVWVASKGEALGTSSLNHAQSIASKYGGKPVISK